MYSSASGQGIDSITESSSFMSVRAFFHVVFFFSLCFGLSLFSPSCPTFLSIKDLTQLSVLCV